MVATLGAMLLVFGWGLVPWMEVLGLVLLVGGVWAYSSLRVLSHLDNTYSRIGTPGLRGDQVERERREEEASDDEL